MSNPKFKLDTNAPTVSWADPRSTESSSSSQVSICVFILAISAVHFLFLMYLFSKLKHLFPFYIFPHFEVAMSYMLIRMCIFLLLVTWSIVDDGCYLLDLEKGYSNNIR